MQALITLGFILLSISWWVRNTYGDSAYGLRCFHGVVNELRIQGCPPQQPCTIRKGKLLPFELDFSFDSPSQPSELVFQALNPYYGGHTYGSYLEEGDCEKGNLGLDCPLQPNTNYTIKADLYIDPEAGCTAGCGGLSENGTGLRETYWSWRVYAEKYKQSSFCSFKVTLDIVQ